MIIGISGKIGAGKDTLCEFLRDADLAYEQRLFAGKLKRIAAILTGREDQYSIEGKSVYLPEWGMTVGEFQQKLGTDAVRVGLHQDAWVIALFADYRPGDNWIITDVRFPNEARAIRDRDGLLIRIKRDSTDLCGRNASHISEIALDDWTDWDYIIDNNGNLGSLKTMAKWIMEEVHKHDNRR
jgi:dephospho-CoA kinase